LIVADRKAGALHEEGGRIAAALFLCRRGRSIRDRKKKRPGSIKSRAGTGAHNAAS